MCVCVCVCVCVYTVMLVLPKHIQFIIKAIFSFTFVVLKLWIKSDGYHTIHFPTEGTKYSLIKQEMIKV